MEYTPRMMKKTFRRLLHRHAPGLCATLTGRGAPRRGRFQMSMRTTVVAVAASATLLSGASRAQEAVAVLSSDQRAYRETYEGFQASFGKPVPVLALGERLPAETRIVLAFGGKAAVQRYPGRVVLVYAVAPGAAVARKDGASIKVMMVPEARALLGALAALQPKLKRLAVLWSSANRAADSERLVKQGAARGVAVSAERLDDAAELPERLRALKGRVDAIWLPPDPLLITPANFEIIKHYSYDNHIPFYAPTQGLAEQGATAAVYVGYEEMGRTMAAAAKGALAGEDSPQEVYSGRSSMAVNRSAAAQAALAVPAEALKAAEKVYP